MDTLVSIFGKMVKGFTEFLSIRTNNDIRRFIGTKFSACLVLTPILGFILAGSAFAQTKIMPLGDSITRGVDGPSTDDAGYRNDLSALLQSEGVPFDFVGTLSDGTGFDPNHEGHDGFRADQIFANINTYLGANPNVIILHIGTNDISNSETPESTRNEIDNIIDAIHSFNSNIKIILSSIIPRADGQDLQTTSLNTLIEDLFYTKRDEGRNVYYAGVNEIIKQNPNWATDYFEPGDDVHPNDDAYNVLGNVYFNVLMTALNSSSTNITDNFERNNLGITWDADPQYALQNGELSNTATSGTGNWQYMATFKGVKNPTSVGIKWGTSADASGINEAGLALLLDGPSQNADGYLAWITTGDNMIRLWTIRNGSTDNDLNAEQASQASVPGAGDDFRVDMTIDGSNLQFNFYVEDVFAGNITIPNPGGLGSELYAGFISKHNLNNNIDEFRVKKTSDTEPPDPIVNLSVVQTTATSAQLSWTATGDDGTTGQASSYDLRYSTQLIDNINFASATQVQGVQGPAPANSIENITVSGLQAGTQYFFAVKVIDEAGNTSTLSNVVTATTIAGNFFADDFDRATLGPDWSADPDYAIVNNQLSNTSGSGAWNEIAVLNARKNPNEISLKYGFNADAAGIDQSGFVIVFGSASPTSDGYAITRRTGANNEIRLWQLINGEIASVIERNQSPNLSPPGPGDIVKIVISSSGASNKFEYFTNDQFDGAVEDTDFLHDLDEDNWSGVTLRASNNNDIDDFTVLLEVGAPANMVAIAGDAQVDTVGQILPIPLTVRLTDDAGSPVGGVNVNFEVLAGGGSVDVAPPKEEIVIEAESGVFTPPMAVGSDGNASGGSYIHVPDGTGGQGIGAAEFVINITEAGNYVMWGRATFPHANADAFKVAIGPTEYTWDVGQRVHSSNWKWDELSHRGSGSANSPELDPVVVNLGVGPVTIKVVEGKDGTLLDQFVLVKENSGFQPPADDSAIVPGGSFTNSNGEASTRLTLGEVPGNNQVRAFSNGVSDVFFTATGAAGTVASINKLSGDGQVGEKGQTLPLPFVVEVRDEFGNLAVGSTTTWTILNGANGSLSQGNQVAVNASGQATNTLTLATNVGLNQVQVSSPGYTGPDVIFTATPNPGAAATIALVSGNDQQGTASTPLANPFKVQVTDDIGTPVPNHDVTFRVIAGGGNFGGSSEVVVASGPDGVAEATLTLGPSPGSTNQAQAISSGLTGSPITFTASSAEPASIAAISPLIHSGIASVPLADSIEVEIKDIQGNSLPNYPVEFSVTLGGGSVNESTSPVNVTTNSLGIAKVQWRLGPSAGSSNNKIRAQASFNNTSLSGSPIEFTASAVVGDAANMFEVSGNNQSGQIETALEQPFKVRVTDIANNPIAGWPVTFSVQAGGGNFSGLTTAVSSTNSEGEAEITLTLGSSAGTPSNPFNNKVQASSQNAGQGLDGSPILFQASAISTGARDLVLAAGNNQTGLAGEPLPQQLQVKVTDGPNNNAIIGHQVFFKVIAGGGTLNGAQITQLQVVTDQNGIATVSWHLGGALGTNSQRIEVTANDGINNLTGSPLTLQATATAGAVDPNASQVISDASALQANGQDEANITVVLTDKFGNPIPNKAIIITATGSNNSIVQPTSLTNSQGQAFGSISSIRAEVKTVSARNLTDAMNLNTSVQVTFLSEPPELVEMSNGNNQSANVGTAVPEPIEVLVTDDFNNPVPGVKVEFQVISGGGFIGETSAPAYGSSQSMAMNETNTDASGKASAAWVLGPSSGGNSAQARAFFGGTELSGSPVLFSAQGLPANATTMSLQAGNNQQGAAGVPLPNPLEVLVTDAQGRAVSGIVINFSVQSGGGRLSEASPLTNHQGIALTRLTLGPDVGTNVVDASNNTLTGSPLTFIIDGVVGPPSKILTHEGDGSTAEVNQVHNVAVKVTDFFDNPNQGIDVDFQIIQGGASIVNHDLATNSEGIANAQVRMPTVTEDVVIKATSADLPGFFTTLTVHVVAGGAQSFAEYSGNSQDGTVGRPLVLPLMVKVMDSFGNAVEGHEVQWVRTVGGGSVSDATTFSDAKGLAWTQFTLGALGNNEAIAIASGITPNQVTFQATGVTNNFPEFVDLTDKEINEGNLLQFQLSASDIDSDPLTYEAENLPGGATFNANSASFSWTPNQSQQGEYEVTFIVRDGRGGLDLETIKITVQNSNNPPVITAYTPTDLNSLIIRKGQVTRFSVTATDSDPGDVVSYSWLLFADHLPPSGQLLSTSPAFDFVGDNFQPATYKIRVDVTDSKDTVELEWMANLVVVSVELSTFSGHFNGFDGVEITWITTREVNNSGFNVLRSNRHDGDYEALNTELLETEPEGRYSFNDTDVRAGKRYFYMLEDVDINGVMTQHGPIEIVVATPEKFEVGQNYPNPFNPTTNIRFQLPKTSRVKIKVFDVLGREVITLLDKNLEADYHVVTWNARNQRGLPVSTGVYYYQIATDEFRETKKMLLVK